jgi:hypothetical protein
VRADKVNSVDKVLKFSKENIKKQNAFVAKQEVIIKKTTVKVINDEKMIKKAK